MLRTQGRAFQTEEAANTVGSQVEPTHYTQRTGERLLWLEQVSEGEKWAALRSGSTLRPMQGRLDGSMTFPLPKFYCIRFVTMIIL